MYYSSFLSLPLSTSLAYTQAENFTKHQLVSKCKNHAASVCQFRSGRGLFEVLYDRVCCWHTNRVQSFCLMASVTSDR